MGSRQDLSPAFLGKRRAGTPERPVHMPRRTRTSGVGTALARFNALRHGITSTATVIPGVECHRPGVRRSPATSPRPPTTDHQPQAQNPKITKQIPFQIQIARHNASEGDTFGLSGTPRGACPPPAAALDWPRSRNRSRVRRPRKRACTHHGGSHGTARTAYAPVRHPRH